MTHIELFAGIGGIALAAEWAGFEPLMFVENNPFCQKVLAKNFPGVPIHDDVRTFDATQFRGVSLVTGGFPCQDISSAGKQAGIVEGKRSSLWFEMLRVVQECEPLFVLAENVPGIRTKGVDRVLYGLEERGYTAEPFVVGAGSAGAPHIRKRAFIVGANTDHLRQLQREGAFSNIGRRFNNSIESRDLLADCCSVGRYDNQTHSLPIRRTREVGSGAGPYLPWRICEPPVPGVVARVPRSMDRIRGLGNACPPQQYYPFLKAIATQLRCTA